MHYNNNTAIKALGERLRSRYLFNIYNDVDFLDFLLIKHKKEQDFKKKITKLIQCTA